jgi:guanylate kinase
MGKSSSGKDTIFKELQEMEDLNLKKIVLYTTRPIRTGETDGVQYHFVSEEEMERLEAEGKIIERRTYETVCGPWNYFTADDENICLEKEDYLAIGTLESYEKIRDYYGEKKVEPIYIEVEDYKRLERAMKREKKQEQPNYEEMCRRFLADTADFSSENLKKAGITKHFLNDEEKENCIQEIATYIRKKKS